MRPTRRRSIVATIATCAAVAVVAPPPVANGAPAGLVAAALPPGTSQTSFSMSNTSYGSRVQGGELPADSGRTAFSWVTCTKLAGRSRGNHLVGVNLGGEGTASGVRTRSWTTETDTADGNVVASNSKTTIVSAEIGPLTINGISLLTRAWHDADGFHASREASIGEVLLDGVPQGIPTFPGQVEDIPGVGTLTFLTGRRRVDEGGAFVTSKAVQIKVEGSGSTITLGAAYSEINRENPAGVMRGVGRAADASALDGAATTGKIAQQPLPCSGTDGEWINNDTVGVDLGDIVLGAASGGTRGNQLNSLNGYGQARGRIASADLGGDQVQLRGIQAMATVQVVDGELQRSIEGTTLGSLTINGETVAIPDPGESIETPVGTLTFAKRLREDAANAVHVIAVQITLLDNTVINLGEARVAYRRY